MICVYGSPSKPIQLSTQWIFATIIIILKPHSQRKNKATTVGNFNKKIMFISKSNHVQKGNDESFFFSITVVAGKARWDTLTKLILLWVTGYLVVLVSQ